jgi:hypothetical protein
MSTDLHHALVTLAGTAPRSAAPTRDLLRRVHRRRTARAMTTSAVGVAAAGAVAAGGLGWWPDLSRVPAPGQGVVATPATEVPVPAGSTAAWDLYPGASLDVGTAPTRTVTEALAAVAVVTPRGDRAELFLMDAADGAWVRPAWATTGVGLLGAFALSPDGATVAVWTEPASRDERPGVGLVDVATGEVTPVRGLALDGVGCYPGGADFAPDGGALAVLTACDVEDGPVVVFDVDPATAEATRLVMIEGTNLAEGGRLAYSPDGDLLAIGSYELDAPYTARTTVVGLEGDVVREWPAALRSESVWYGNDAIRATQLEQTDEGEWKGWLVPSTGAAIGEIRSYDESPWDYGTPPPRVGRTHGQEVRAHAVTPEERAAGATPWAFEIADPATGTVRAWLPVLDSTASPDQQPSVLFAMSSLVHRAR